MEVRVTDTAEKNFDLNIVFARVTPRDSHRDKGFPEEELRDMAAKALKLNGFDYFPTTLYRKQGLKEKNKPITKGDLTS